MRVAVVGFGHWGPNLVRNLAALPGVGSIAVSDRDPARVALAAERHPKVDPVGDYDRVLGDPSIEAVLLATPISTHAELGLAALDAGKHLFVEKPLAGSVADARRLVERADAKGRILAVGHTFEFSPAVRTIASLVKNGDLGRIFFVTMTRVNLGLHQRDASVIWDLAPHDVAMLVRWLGERPASVHATARDCAVRGIPDVAFLQLAFPSGVIANLEVAWLAPSKLRRTTIVGERKMLVYDDTEATEKVKIYDQGVDFREPEDFGEFQLSYRTGDIVSPRITNEEPLRLEMAHFIDCVREGRRPENDGRSGLAVVEVLEAAHASLANGQRVAI